jgi:hypothetical protein
MNPDASKIICMDHDPLAVFGALLGGIWFRGGLLMSKNGPG